ncbi:MAG TPA: ABC transporter permease, partial [Phenylobacterium sp.]|nr:ABC transporter permease [Phenylobacterium sp.]
MWSNYALALYRTLSRHRLYAALNVLGLALGIAVCLILTLVVRYELSFDKWIPDAANIYRVNQIFSVPGRPSSDNPSTPAVLLPSLVSDFPQIRSAARIASEKVPVGVGDQRAYDEVEFVDPSLFDVFHLPFVAGSPKTALADTGSLVISESAARKYFGTDHALGRTLSMLINGEPRDFRVTGILKDLPPNTHLGLDLLVRLDPVFFDGKVDSFDKWGSTFLYTYVRLPSPADAARLRAGMRTFVARRVSNSFGRHPEKYVAFDLVPLTAIHFHDAHTTSALKPGADPLFVAALGILGLVTLAIAVVNYVSLATARAGMRAREVAVRKVMGATRRALVVQFVAESVAVALLAGLVAAALAELAMPGVNAMLGEAIRIHYLRADGVLLPLAGLCLVVGLLSGIYPALVLSGFRPASVLASARTPGGGRTGARVRQGLAIFQFSIAIMLMICTTVIFTQMQYVRNSDAGFHRDGLIIVEGLGEPQVAPRSEALLDAFRQTRGALSVSASDRRPGSSNQTTSNVNLLSNPTLQPVLTIEGIGPDYGATFGLHLLAGRFLGLAQRLDDLRNLSAPSSGGSPINAMINRTGAKALGFSNPEKALGQKMSYSRVNTHSDLVITVVGVVDDARFLSARDATPPVLYLQDTRLGTNGLGDEWNAAVRVREADQASVTASLGRAWRAIVPGTPFRAKSVQAAMKPYYDPDARRGQLFASGAVLSAIIACLGLYGLAAFNTGRRFKEIGIRKTLGASTRDVMRLLIGEFLKPVLIANVIAWPLAWFAMRAWLAGFDQRIALNPAYFIAPTLAAVIVAVLTVADQTFRVARAE